MKMLLKKPEAGFDADTGALRTLNVFEGDDHVARFEAYLGGAGANVILLSRLRDSGIFIECKEDQIKLTLNDHQAVQLASYLGDFLSKAIEQNLHIRESVEV